MTLQSDTDALAAIEEEAERMLKLLGLPDDRQKREVAIGLRQIIAIARYRSDLGLGEGAPQAR
jgi:ABC-type methionine transport system ATPase subunit